MWTTCASKNYMIFHITCLLLCVASSNILFGVAERLNSKRKLGWYDWTCGPVVYEGKLSAPMTVTSSIDHCLDVSLTKNWDFWELDVVEGVSYSIDFHKINCDMDPVITVYKVNTTSDVQCMLVPYYYYRVEDIKGLSYIQAGIYDDSIPSSCPWDGQHISFTPDSTGTYALTVANSRHVENITCIESYGYELSFDLAPRCVSVNGKIKEQYGDPAHATCASWHVSGSDGCNNVAIAEGKHSTAIAGTKANDKCITVNATGYSAYASASGTYQVASAEGSNTKAIIHDGSQNTAVARGPSGVFVSACQFCGTNRLPHASLEVTGTLNNVLALEAVAKVNGTSNSLTVLEGHEGFINGDYNTGEGKGRTTTFSCGKFGCSTIGSFSIIGNSNTVHSGKGVVSITGDSNYGSSTQGCQIYIDGEYNTGNCEVIYPSGIGIRGTRNNVNVTGNDRGTARADGNENTVICSGNFFTQAEATGDRNYVSAMNAKAKAKVIGGNGNTVKAEWQASQAIVYNGDGNHVYTGEKGAKARVLNGSGNTAGAEAEDSVVSIEDGDNNSVTHNVSDCHQSITGVSGQIITGCS